MELQRFNRRTRESLFDEVSTRYFDLLVIGGGITGASILRDAALRGLKTILVEARDFAIGTSSRSSKLVHGGLRYLKTGSPRVTWDSCHERDLQIRLNRRLVSPEPFLIPVYKTGGQSKGLLKIGMIGYELMSGFRNFQRHRFVSRDEVLLRAPGIRSEGLAGAYEYYDAIVNDYRFSVETIKDGIRAGGIALNYCPVFSIEKENMACAGAVVENSLNGKRYTIRAKCIVNAAGVGADEIRRMDDALARRLVRLSKGTHIVLRAQDVPATATMALSSPVDKRMVFLIKYDGHFLFGTTDDWEENNGQDPAPGAKDTAYLLTTLRLLMPGANFDETQIRHAYSGFRPLISDTSSNGTPNHVSRGDHTEVSAFGLISVLGGKLTTARHMAEKCVDMACKRTGMPGQISKCVTRSKPLGSSNEEVAGTIQFWSAKYPELKDAVMRLCYSYGTDASAMIQRAIQTQPPLANDFSLSLEAAEIEYLCKNEMVCRVSDLVDRRLSDNIWEPEHRLKLVEKHKNIVLDSMGITEPEFSSQINR